MNEEEGTTVSQENKQNSENMIDDFANKKSIKNNSSRISHSYIYLVFICIIAFGYNYEEKILEKSDVTGIIVVCLTVLVILSMYLPDSLLVKPHPLVWRIFHGIGIIYLLLLVFLLFQSADSAKRIFVMIDKELEKPLEVKLYNEHCSLTTDQFPYVNFANILIPMDFYAVIHFVGWIFKMIYVRNAYICWFVSVTWEVIEISLGHEISDFYECWWDSIILDVIVCNAAGIWVGDLICKYFEKSCRQNDSADLSRTKSFFNCLLPQTWNTHDWDTFASFKNFYSTLHIIIFLHLYDLSNFLLKFVFQLPPSHSILVYRLLIWAGLTGMSVLELYQFFYCKLLNKLANVFLLSHLLIFLEYAVFFKYAKGKFNKPFPLLVVIFWAGLAFGIFVISILLLIKDYKKKKSQ